MLADAPSKIHISDVHKQMLRTSSKFREDESCQQITLGVHVEKRRWNENTTHAPSEQNQKCIASHWHRPATTKRRHQVFINCNFCFIHFTSAIVSCQWCAMSNTFWSDSLYYSVNDWARWTIVPNLLNIHSRSASAEMHEK